MNPVDFSQLNTDLIHSRQFLLTAGKIALVLLISVPLLYLIRSWIRRIVMRHYTEHYGMLAGKFVFYTGVIIIVMTIFNQLGFSLAPILGAAGVVGIVLGVASQTSVSNIISGIFMIAEQAFVVGDVISIGETTGVVMSIDTLSVKLRTFDNKFVRIPNETLIKSLVTNNTRFPIRRIDCKVSIAYKENIGRVKEVLTDIANRNPLVFQEPKPLFIFKGFNDSSIDLQFSVWATKEDWLQAKNEMYEEIKKRFDEENIEIPFPHVSLYAGTATGPIPVTLRDSQLNPPAGAS